MTDFKSIIEKAGAEYLSVRGEGEDALVYFNDPKTNSTHALPPHRLTLKAVKEKMEESRRRFGV